jgi:hypothetical protein
MGTPERSRIPIMSKDTRAAVYGRKSDDDQEGVASQWELCARRAEEDGRHVPDGGEYRFGDNDASGKDSSRDEFQRLIAVVKGGRAPFRYVYVKDKTRLGRWLGPRKHSYYECLLEEHGVKVIYCSQKEEIDFSAGVSGGQIGYFLKDSVDNFYAAQERLEFLRRSKIGMRQAVMRGSYPGHVVPYATHRVLVSKSSGAVLGTVGTHAHRDRETTLIKLEWDGGESLMIVREIFARILKGHSLHEIAADLNRRNVCAPRGKGWLAGTVGIIARNEIYRGDLVWGRNGKRVPIVPCAQAKMDGPEAIRYASFMADPPISRKDFESVQTILSGNREHWSRRFATGDRYLLSGLVVCMACGCNYRGTIRRHFRGATSPEDCTLYYRHMDVRHRKLGYVKVMTDEPDPRETPRARVRRERQEKQEECTHRKHIRAELLEESVLRSLEEALSGGTLVNQVEKAIQERLGMEAISRERADKRRVEKKVEQVTRAINRAITDSLTADSESVRTQLNEVRDRMGRELDDLKDRLESYAVRDEQLSIAMANARELRERALQFWEALRSGEARERKEALAALIVRIEVDCNKSIANVVVRGLDTTLRVPMELENRSKHQPPDRLLNTLDTATLQEAMAKPEFTGSDLHRNGRLDLIWVIDIPQPPIRRRGGG